MGQPSASPARDTHATETILDWLPPINQLNPQQTRILADIATDQTTNHWVSGYAGTGKTVVVAQAIERIAARTRSATICFIAYTHALKDLVESGLSDAARDRVTIETVDRFERSNTRRFDYIVVDEVQDLTVQQIRQIIEKGKHVIAAGDPDQGIYPGKVLPKQLAELLGGAKKHTLKQIQRLSPKVLEMAKAVLPEAKVEGSASPFHDGNPGKLIKGSSERDEFLKVYHEACRVSENGYPSAILFPRHEQILSFAKVISEDAGWGEPPERDNRPNVGKYEAFNSFFERKKSPLRFLGSNNGSLPESDQKKIVFLMTYHSAKGLDFNNVFLPQLNEGEALNPVISRNPDLGERRLFFVALTRSKETVYLSHSDEKHRLLRRLPPECIETWMPPSRLFGRQ
jgi:UvrD-like helicase C-terminal domain/AAA domain